MNIAQLNLLNQLFNQYSHNVHKQIHISFFIKIFRFQFSCSVKHTLTKTRDRERHKHFQSRSEEYHVCLGSLIKIFSGCY